MDRDTALVGGTGLGDGEDRRVGTGGTIVGMGQTGGCIEGMGLGGGRIVGMGLGDGELGACDTRRGGAGEGDLDWWLA